VERAPLEALLVTPVRLDEILLGKTLPYFSARMVGSRAVAFWLSQYLFHVPLPGSLWCCSVHRCCTCWWRLVSAC